MDALLRLRHVHLDDLSPRSLDLLYGFGVLGFVAHCAHHAMAGLEGPEREQEAEAVGDACDEPDGLRRHFGAGWVRVDWVIGCFLAGLVWFGLRDVMDDTERGRSTMR